MRLWRKNEFFRFELSKQLFAVLIWCGVEQLFISD